MALYEAWWTSAKQDSSSFRSPLWGGSDNGSSHSTRTSATSSQASSSSGLDLAAPSSRSLELRYRELTAQLQQCQTWERQLLGEKERIVSELLLECEGMRKAIPRPISPPSGSSSGGATSSSTSGGASGSGPISASAAAYAAAYASLSAPSPSRSTSARSTFAPSTSAPSTSATAAPQPDIEPPSRQQLLSRLIDGKREDYRRIFVPGRGWVSKSKLQSELRVSEFELEKLASR